MTRRSRSPARPHSKTKAARRALSPDQAWAARIIRRMLLDCHPWQRDAVIDPSRRLSMLVGRGGAKTTTMRVRAMIKLLWLPNQRIGFAATSAEHARELNWDPLKDMCEAYGVRMGGPSPDVSFLDTKMRMVCHRTSSVYRLRGVEDKKDADRFRGFPQAEMQGDEVGSFSPDLLVYLLTQCVAPRLGQALALPPGLLQWLIDLDDEDIESEFEIPEEFLGEHRGGCIVIGSTPPPYQNGEFYEVTRDGSTRHRPYAKRDQPEYANWKGYSSHAWEAEQVVKLPRARELFAPIVANWEEALVEKAEKGWSDDNPIWLREYKGKWARDNTTTIFKYRPHVDGKPWNQWDPLNYPDTGQAWSMTLADLRKAIDALPKDVGTWHYVLADDMGSKDPFACNVLAFAPRDPERRIFHVYCFERQGMHAKPIAELTMGDESVARALAGKPAEPYGGLLGVIGWPDGMIMDADQATLDELSKVYGLRFLKAERKADYKFGAIELTNGEFVDGRLKILKGSPLEKQVLVLQWKPDDNGNPREDKAQANHSSDTLIFGRKLIATLFESGAVELEKTAAPPVYVDPMGLDDGARERPVDLASLLADPTFDDDDSGWP